MRRVCLSILIVLAFAFAASAQVIPYALPPDASPVPPRRAEDLWRFNEAMLKGRFVEKMLTTDAGATPNMDLYDATWYGLDLMVDPTAHQVSGTVTMRVTVTGASLATLDLHLAAGMTVDGIATGATPLSFTRVGEVVTATLDRAYTQGEDVSLAVTYHGNPAGDAFGWSSISGQTLVWTLSEPYGARTWWPCKDLNADKADSADVTITVPQNLIVASNGRLVSQTTNGGWATYHWHEQYRISTYLISFAAHPYVVFSEYYHYSPTDSMEVRNFVSPSYESQARTGYAAVPQMIGVFAGAYGEYPFIAEKYGHAHFTWGGGMEHQTCSSMSYGYYADTFIAHELSHQWWGDMVTCADFHHIWLNEGFATWSEAYWREQHEGEAAYRDEMAAAEYYGAGTVIVEDPGDFNGIFDYNLSYLKASWVVHMLRGVLGDDDFFAGLALYRQQHEYDVATTEDLQAALEAVSGRDLGAFFQQWIYGEYFPQYAYSYAVTPQGGQYLVQVRIEQTQTNAGVFVMPIDLKFTTFNGAVRRRVENDQRVQYYSFLLNANVQGAAFDPDHWILAQVTQVAPTAVGPPDLAANLSAYPNPFNPATNLRFTVPTAGPVQLAIYDVRGHHVRTLLHEEHPAGAGTIRWDGADDAGRALASGTYYARLVAGASRSVTSLVLVR